MFKVLIGVVVVAVAALVVFMVIDPSIGITTTEPNSVIIVNDDSLSIAEGYFSATIEGEVTKPGSYVLEDGSTMGDLIECAGGITPYGDDYAYYDDALLTSGMTYYIPSKYDTSDVCQLVEIQKVNINTASLEQLLEVKAFTNSVASSLISYRVENGEFKTLESILDVYGIGNATYRKLRNYIILHQ